MGMAFSCGLVPELACTAPGKTIHAITHTAAIRCPCPVLYSLHFRTFQMVVL